MKTKEELNVLKEGVEALNRKLAELTDDELQQVTGGDTWWLVDKPAPVFDPKNYSGKSDLERGGTDIGNSIPK